ncbi:transglycosylase SLT domain-containing protein [Candidatus Poribacteria bacterium]|jgi:soluble lytic murein transglycosylase|nr:transglycosylase SLT domain-containing protein [Candidatus Poribacteria bacterium]MBT5535663.1 transglycosylase SLT domain-containing protein [Candidatus Poribacteria bacterium]MBT5713982.1 transglycosylase SLT domain-containing protein [Candidatus Poribacteria bacterium]MBT7100681.1 transglycosylase SLT domain-containing protein [Candidatus Poribacteria bacterium]MBT7806669.1 transglycosylase SLT domain-containing protein [Candidatus Poribacteria bacterium]
MTDRDVMCRLDWAGRLRAGAGVAAACVLLALLAACREPVPEPRQFESLLTGFQGEGPLSADLDKRVGRFLRKADEHDLRRQLSYAYGRALQERQRYEEAGEAYARCDVAEFALRDFARYYRGQCLAELERYDEAAAQYRSILDDFPDFPLRESALLRVGKAHENGGQYAAGLAVFQTLVAERGLGREAQYFVGVSHEGLGAPQAAYEAYQQVIEDQTDDSFAQRAVAKIERLAQSHPELKLSRAHKFVHAQVLHGSGERKKARATWEIIHAGHEDELGTRARYEIGRSYLRDRQYNNAIRTFEGLLRSGHPNYKTRAQFQRILATRRSGQRTRALRLFREFITENPWSSLLDDVMMEYGWTLRDARDFATARKAYAEVVAKFPKSAQAPEAAWLTAWCDIRLKRHAQSMASLNTLILAYPTSDYAGRGHFWLGKVHERLGNPQRAADAYRQVVEMDTYYYGARADEKLRELSDSGAVGPEYIDSVQRMVRQASVSVDTLHHMPIARVEMLTRLDDDAAAIAEMESLLDRGKDDRPLLYYHLMQANERLGRTYRAYIMAYRFSNLPEVRWSGDDPPVEVGQLLYPIPFEESLVKAGEEFGVDPHYLAAMIREESRFNASVVSWAGAYGLMQVMPDTGKRIAPRIGIEEFDKDMLLDPEVNIRMGAWYIRFLLDEFGGDFSLVSGAYNAGEGRMGQWRDRYAITDLDEFIEQVPYDETRNHIKKVMHSYHVYRHLYGEDEEPAQLSPVEHPG